MLQIENIVWYPTFMSQSFEIRSMDNQPILYNIIYYIAVGSLHYNGSLIRQITKQVKVIDDICSLQDQCTATATIHDIMMMLLQ